MESGTPTEEQRLQAVGEMFLVEYYKLASENTANLHKFYRKNAVGSFGDATQIAGSTKIGEKLACLSGAIFDLETGGVTCSFQPTAEGGLLIMVSGLVQLQTSTAKHEPAKRFVQTFHLVRSKDPNTYAIANDLHRFLNTSSDAKAASAAAAPSSPAKPVAVNGQQIPPATVSAAAVAAPPQASPAEMPRKEEVAKPQPLATAPPKEQEKPKSSAPVVESPAASSAQPPKQERAPKTKPPAPATGNQASAPAEKKPEVAAPVPAKPSGPPSYSQVAAKSSPQQSSTSNGGSAASAARKELTSAPLSSASAAVPSVYVKNGSSVPQKALTDLLVSSFGPVASVTAKGAAVIVAMTSPKDAEALLAAKEIVVEGSTLQTELYRGAGGKTAAGASSSSSGGAQRRQGASSTDGNRRLQTSSSTTGAPSKDRASKPSAQSGSSGASKQPVQSSNSKPTSSTSAGGASRPSGGSSGRGSKSASTGATN